MNPTPFEVYALRYATHEGRRGRENFIFPDFHDDEQMPLDFFVWVIRSEQRTIVVDTGFDSDTARKRQRTFLHDPVELLARLGIAAAAVTDLVVTHMHYDHCGNLLAFPNARIHIQDEEMAYCTGRCMGHATLRQPFEAKDVMNAIRCLFEGRLVFHKGSATLADGIGLHHVGGHTKGLQVVSVPTARGRIVLASDAAHYWTNLRERRPFPIVVDLEGMLEAYGTIETLADGPYHIIPGHDPRVLSVFPHLPNQPDIAILHAEPIGHAAAFTPL
ncbi:N-acyl homoserine lactonase family protein [Paucibacter sp. APW11]|uniref:N-acyl homoserine lactonase family protein n=1 Tax=Roseateles aquae TaxID=3077235 RepID=A0ABU3PGD9_9BURK|nr:N-acyl homoserine lactonase family protein [Paucibacter sp. APW11]MDT9001656.1 N-acyl homoserine lactonase family protein [Paucibacter sp. APW11]